MSEFSERLRTRSRIEQEAFESALERIGASVTGERARDLAEMDVPRYLDEAVGAIFEYFHLTPTKVSSAYTDQDKRLDALLHPQGIMRRRVRLVGKWYRSAVGAMLGFLENGTPVALLPHGVAGYCFVDPVSGQRVQITKENAHCVKKDAFCLYRPLPHGKLEVRDIARFAFAVLDIDDYLMLVFVSVLAAVIGLLPAWANNVVFENVIPYGNANQVLPIAGLLFGAAFSQATINMSRSLIIARLGSKLDASTLAAVMARVLLLPPDFFIKEQPGELASRVLSISTLAQLLVNVVFTTGLSLVISLVYVVQIFFLAPPLVWPAIAVIAANIILAIASTWANERYNCRQLENNANLAGLFAGLLAGIGKIKLSGAERRAFTRWAENYAQVASDAYDRPLLLKASYVLVTAVSLIGVMLFYFIAASAKVTVADYMSFNVAYGVVSGAIMAFASVSNQIASIRPTMQLVMPLLEREPESHGGEQLVESISGAVELTNVTYRYGVDSPAVIDKLSLSIRPGEHVAIVGRTGSGKTTLVRLLLGFARPDQGGVYYDGRDLAALDVRSLRRQIGVVLQDGKLVPGTIYENITLASAMPTMDDAWKAAEIAGIAQDIRNMPMGMKTRICEGSSNISVGQRQRLLIARAIADNPKLLVFDEAMSSLDAKMQRQVMESLSTLDCTRIVVAHRLSTVRSCDRVLVLEDGHIVEDGTFDELMADNGPFADFVASWSKA